MEVGDQGGDRERPRKPHGRLTVVKQLYWQGSSSTEAAVRRSAWCMVDEQPYVRDMKLAGGWQLVDTGWLPLPCYVSLRNDSEENVLLSLEASEFGAIPPGDSTELLLFKSMHVQGKGKLHVVAFP